MVAAGLDGALGVADLFEDRAVVFEVLGEAVFLLADFRQQDAEFIGYVGDGVVARGLAPIGELGGDRDAFAAGGFVGSDGVVFRLNYFEELFA